MSADLVAVRHNTGVGRRCRGTDNTCHSPCSGTTPAARGGRGALLQGGSDGSEVIRGMSIITRGTGTQKTCERRTEEGQITEDLIV